MQDWFETGGTQLDDWTMWTQHPLTRAPMVGFERGIKDFPAALQQASFRSVIESALESPHGVVFLCTLFAGARLLYADPVDDETSYVCTAPDAHGRCAVFHFNPRVSSVVGPGWEDIRCWLSSLATGARGSVEQHPLLHRAQRTSWLAAKLVGIGFGDVVQDVASASAATDFDPSSSERGDVLYWLWHHAICGNVVALDALLERTVDMTDVWVIESAAWIRAHAGHWDEAFGSLDFETVQALRQAMPARCFEGPRTELSAREVAQPPLASGSPAVARFSAWLDDGSMSQRERLRALETERRAELIALLSESPSMVLGLLRRAINSKKLKADLERLIAQLSGPAH